MALIDKPGLYQLEHAAYHADPCVEPSLSAHDCDNIELSPLHAWITNPRLNLAAEPFEPSADMNFGSLMHDLLAGQGEARVVWVKADDYRTNAAKEARDAALAAGKVPLLARQQAEIYALVRNVRDQMKAYPLLWSIMSAPGKTERTMIARDRGIWLRAMGDWVPDDPLLPQVDWKMTKRNASPAAYDRAVQNDYSLRMHHYSRTRKLATGAPRAAPVFLCVVETEAPHGLMLHAMDDELADYAEKRWEAAFSMWSHCLGKGRDKEHWPGYPQMVNYVGVPAWLSRQWDLNIALAEDRRKGMSIAQGHALAEKLGAPVQ